MKNKQSLLLDTGSVKAGVDSASAKIMASSQTSKQTTTNNNNNIPSTCENDPIWTHGHLDTEKVKEKTVANLTTKFLLARKP